ncbi:SDR family NAD(P)-dependent oxidoreductase [Yinghuangia soli]|uniref:SDR family oxidoreductase n=1 Tax=Yinghuangia soli TaxID=2908204 RepID=A0AA41Q5Z5_9ACTN|nr:SDR family NAD(P)-dependent oxidoreductase [Yinghuangia soli]MCF2531862.1 SDR family oxidoreductase [Yinghuangia soli]
MGIFDLDGKSAFVTGASRGIGRAVALAYAAAGADVALAARSADALAEVADEVKAAGRRALVLPCDVTDPAAVEAAARAAVEGLGRVDILVNNAGGVPAAGPAAGLDAAGWEATWRLNLDSAVNVCRALAPELLARGDASVINMTSVAGIVGVPFLSAYGAAKGGIAAYTRGLAAEWAAAGVRVNAICPGPVCTDLNRPFWEHPAVREQTAAVVPMRRWGQPEEVAGVAVFLASRAASYITGQVLAVDGGQTSV